MWKRLLLVWTAPLLALWGFCFLRPLPGQYLPTTFSPAASYTDYFGGTVSSDHYDNDNAGYGFAMPFVVPPGGATLSNVFKTVILLPQNAVHGICLVADNGGKPDGGSILCSQYATSTPSSGLNLFTVTGCPATLTGGAKYYVGVFTNNNTEEQGRSESSCLSGDAFYTTITMSMPWGATWPASTKDVGACHSGYVTLTFTSPVFPASPFTIFHAYPAGSTTTPTKFTIPATGNGNSLIIAHLAVPSANPWISDTDSGGDTITQNGTCAGVTSGYQPCLTSVARVSSGVTWVDSTFTQGGGGWHNNSVIMEVGGTLSSASYDVSKYDTAYTGTPFTSGSAGPTNLASEIFFGVAGDSSCGEDTYTAGANWTLITSINNIANGCGDTLGVFFRVVTSTGSYSLQGSNSHSGTSNILGLGGYR